MDWILPRVVLLIALISTDVESATNPSVGAQMDQTLKSLSDNIAQLTRQIMADNTAREERVRSEGDSGIKMIRNNRYGTRPYFSETYSMRSFASIHDHSNNIRTVGMGEVIGVINGVEFRTRHNDYRLRMPSTSSKNYHETEDIPFPPVPKQVTDKATANEQIEEMQEYFRAWSTQNVTHRDYTEYFKPVLCYMEGAWTKGKEKIDEPFFSDRHYLKAKTWLELLQKIRLTSYTGSKNNLENYAYLPTTIMHMTDDNVPIFAQWNYRILCHPLKRQVPLKMFQVVDDLASRMARKKTLAEHAMTRAARFILKPKETDKFKDVSYSYGFLDKLMEEIPGKDNYQADLKDDSMGRYAYDVDMSKVKNVGFYHRTFTMLKRGAMGTRKISRGFNDNYMFVSMNTRTDVAPMVIKRCKGRGRKRVCSDYSVRCSWAIPLEIIYMTPLNNWNPYDIEYKGSYRSDRAKSVTERYKRRGKLTKDLAFNGTHSKLYFRTPFVFFGKRGSNRSPADTSRYSVGVLDKKGDVKTVRASGTYIFWPPIADMGSLRQRYPIAPVHDEGDNMRKELEALKDIVMDSERYQYLLHKSSHGNSGKKTNKRMVILLTSPSRNSKVARHTHTIELTSDELYDLQISKKTLTKYTSTDINHRHLVKIKYLYKNKYLLVLCDGKYRCWDYHSRVVYVKKTG